MPSGTDCNEARLSLVQYHGNTKTLVDLEDFYFSFQFTDLSLTGEFTRPAR